jgi:putative oxygen-independent coproporphyrinogen III oxidase
LGDGAADGVCGLNSRASAVGEDGDRVGVASGEKGCTDAFDRATGVGGGHGAYLSPVMEPLALYIHWPFCLAKCPYCDFNSHVRERIDQGRFAAALRRELAWEAERLGRRRLESIFFGGGTPSLMAPETVAALIQDATRFFDPVPEMEITLEANPTSVEAGKFAAFRAAGVNRVSIGVQSLDESALKMLGRQHSVAQGIAALETGRRIFPRLSFDLIYARPGQEEAAWRFELRRALALVADHLSIYQLTIEPGTVFEGRYRRGEIMLPEEETQAALYQATADEVNRFGLQPYEISNYAKTGAESRHNLMYWQYGDYAGIGAGAHGRVTIGDELHATRRHRAPEVWAERVECEGHGTTDDVVLTAQDRAREMLLVGLRLYTGVDVSRFTERTGLALVEAMDLDVLARAVSEGYMQRDLDRVRATEQGMLRLDALLRAVIL